MGVAHPRVGYRRQDLTSHVRVDVLAKRRGLGVAQLLVGSGVAAPNRPPAISRPIRHHTQNGTSSLGESPDVCRFGTGRLPCVQQMMLRT